MREGEEETEKKEKKKTRDTAFLSTQPCDARCLSENAHRFVFFIVRFAEYRKYIISFNIFFFMLRE